MRWCVEKGGVLGWTPSVVTLSMMDANKYGLGLQDLVTSSDNKYLSFLRTSYELIGAVKGER